MIITEEAKEKFFKLTLRETSTGCLLWTGSGGASPRFTMPKGPTIRARKVAWMIANGSEPIDIVGTKCKTLNCVEATHLVLGAKRSKWDLAEGDEEDIGPRPPVVDATAIRPMRGSQPCVISDKIKAKFFACTQRASDDSGCLLWIRPKKFFITVNGKNVRVRRLAWMISKNEIPGDAVGTTCDTANCVEIKHLAMGAKWSWRSRACTDDDEEEEREDEEKPWGYDAEEEAAERRKKKHGPDGDDILGNISDDDPRWDEDEEEAFPPVFHTQLPIPEYEKFLRILGPANPDHDMREAIVKAFLIRLIRAAPEPVPGVDPDPYAVFRR